LWLHEYTDEEELRQALYRFREKYNKQWILQRHGYRTPQQVRDEWNKARKLAS
jgi:hypothetical protein